MARSALARPLASRVASSTASAAAVPAAAAPARMPLPSLSAAAAASIAAATASLTAGLCAAFIAALPALRSGLGSLPPPALPPFFAFLSLPISNPLLFDDDARPHADHSAEQIVAADGIAAGPRHEGDRLVRQRRQVQRAVPHQHPVSAAQLDRPEEARGGESVRLLRIVDEVEPHRLAGLEPDHLRTDLEAGDEHVIFGRQRPFLGPGRRAREDQEQGEQRTAHRTSSTIRLLPQRLARAKGGTKLSSRAKAGEDSFRESR